jgi:hypothetical protein
LNRLSVGRVRRSSASCCEADLLSYIFFDACYAERLIALGRRDAAQAEDELVALFSS